MSVLQEISSDDYSIEMEATFDFDLSQENVEHIETAHDEMADHSKQDSVVMSEETVCSDSGSYFDFC